MNNPTKIIQLTPEDRDRLRLLKATFVNAEFSLRKFESDLKARHAPAGRAYAPFYKQEMEILDDLDQDTTHIYFTQRLQ